MSNEYTNKIVLFSKENFEGDALVIMWDPSHNTSHFCFKNFRYRPYNSQQEKEFNALSLVCIEGEWNIDAFGQHIKARLVLPNFVGYLKQHNSKIQNLTAINNDKVDSAESKSHKGISEPSCFKMKFFPQRHSFIVSPAPDCLMGPEHGFRWVFRNANELTIEYQQVGGLSKPRLEFCRRSVNEPVSRVSPIEVKDDKGQWHEPIYTYNLEGDSSTIRFKSDENKDPEYWFFNFCCKIGVESVTVDPEMQSGAGIAK